MLERGLRPREVDQHVGRLRARRDRRRRARQSPRPSERGAVAPSVGLPARSSATVICRSGAARAASIEHAAHAAGRAGDRESGSCECLVVALIGASAGAAVRYVRYRDAGSVAVSARIRLALRPKDQRVGLVLDRHRIGVEAVEAVFLEVDDELGDWFAPSLAADSGSRCSPRGPCGTRSSIGRAEHEANLVARHADAQLIDHFLGDDVALRHVGPVRLEEGRRPRQHAAAGAEMDSQPASMQRATTSRRW